MTKFEIVVPTEWGKPYFEGLCKVFEDNTREWAFALHVPDEQCNFEHWHIGGLLHSSRTIDDIWCWFSGYDKVLKNSIEKIKFHWKTYLCYLQHKTKDAIQKGKTPPSEWGGNADFETALTDYETKGEYDTLINDILNYKLREYQFYSNTALVEKIIKEGRLAKVKQAFECADKNRLNNSTTRQSGRNQCWIFGKAGSGKTVLAKWFCREHGYKDEDIYVTSSGNNPFDDYKQQPCIIIDDIDAETMSPKTALKLADCFTGSAVKARYANKVIDAEVVIFTSTCSPSAWWKALAQERTDGNVYQLLRRLTLGSWLIEEDSISLTLYDGQGEMLYTAHMEMPKEVLDTIRSERTQKQALDFLTGHFKISSFDKVGNKMTMDIDAQSGNFSGNFELPFIGSDDGSNGTENKG